MKSWLNPLLSFLPNIKYNFGSKWSGSQLNVTVQFLVILTI